MKSDSGIQGSPDTLPSFSIVTPSFNHAKFIGATIQSVLDQNYPRLQYKIIDGGSTDGTVEILKTFPKVEWSSEADRGQTDAINKGFGGATGEILAWLNSDDTYAPGALMAAAEIFAARPDVVLVYGNADFIDADGKIIAPCAHVEPFNFHRLLCYSDYLVQPAVFFRRDAVESVGGLDASLNWAMDYDLWLKLAKKGKFVYLPIVLANYRWLGGSKTAGGGMERIEEVRRVAMRHGAPGLPAFFHLEAVRLHLANCLGDLRGARLLSAFGHAMKGIASLVSSPRAIKSLFSVKTWRIIRTGRKLRR